MYPFVKAEGSSPWLAISNILSEIIQAPRGKYPDVSPFAHVIISGIIPKTSSDANQCPKRPNPVTTSSDM